MRTSGDEGAPRLRPGTHRVHRQHRQAVARRGKAHELAERNPTRVHLVEKLEKLVEAYNLATIDAEAFFQALKRLVSEMDEEERRAVREAFTEDELAIFDLLTKPEPKLTAPQEAQAKRIARELFDKLQGELLVPNWRAKMQTRAAVRAEIEVKLNQLPEEPYPELVWNTKVDAVWQFVFHHYPGPVSQRTSAVH